VVDVLKIYIFVKTNKAERDTHDIWGPAIWFYKCIYIIIPLTSMLMKTGMAMVVANW